MGKINIQFLNTLDWQPGPESPVLNNGEVHVYRIQISVNLQLLDLFSATLTPAEKDRGSKYFQLKDRQRFVISRGAQRKILGRYLKIPAEKLTFGLGPNKKPYLLNEGGAGIYYNISHSGDWIMLAIAKTTVGADVEYIDPAFPFRDVLNDNFSAEENRFINEDNSRKRFFLLWTRKEALLKATGQGLDEHLDKTPSLDGEHHMPIQLLGHEQSWQISSFDLTQDYLGSVVTSIRAEALYFDVNF